MQAQDTTSLSKLAKTELISIIESKDAVIEARENKIRLLEFTLEKYRRALFKGKSEKHLPSDPSDIEPELGLFSDQEHRDAEARLEEVEKKEESESTVKVSPHTRRKIQRTVDCSCLEVREEIIDPDGITDENRDDYVFIGEEVTDVLETEPRRLYIRRTRRRKYALKSKLQMECPDRKAVLIADMPDAVLFRGCLASTATMADIIVQKFFYHMPHYRLLQQYMEYGLRVPSSTVNDWFNSTCDLMRFLYNALRRELMKSRYIHCDETFFNVLDEDTHKVRQLSMWALCDALGDNVLFLYEFGKKNGEVAREILKSFNGVIQTDASALYEQFESDPTKVMLGCLVHARRYLISGRSEDAPTADTAIAAINRLYTIEHNADIARLSYDERRELRRRESYPILQDLEKYLSSKSNLYVEKSPMNKAIGYILRHMPKLARYVNEGWYFPDNNDIELCIRPLKVGLNSYGYSHSHDAAYRAAMMYSFIATCNKADVNPREWLIDILPKLKSCGSDYDLLAKLLPGEWKKSHPESKSMVHHTTEEEHVQAILKSRTKRKLAAAKAKSAESADSTGT